MESNRKESSMEIKIAFSGIGGVGVTMGANWLIFTGNQKTLKFTLFRGGKIWKSFHAKD